MENSSFPTKKLKPLCSKIGSGATPRGGSKVYLDHGNTSLIRSQNVRNECFDHNGLVFIEKKHADQLSNVAVEEHDVLLNITGDSVARCCQVDARVLPARVNQHVAIIRPKSEQLDPRFLRYFLISPDMQNLMLGLAGAGATRNALTKGMIEEFDIPVPDITEQKAIAHILGSLDDKIELNRRMNETLEAMAQALFKSWFVDFDPVIDNALAKRNEIPENLKERAETRAALGDARKPLPEEIQNLFPSEFEHTEEMGWIPKGWKVSDMSRHAIIEMGQSPKGETYNDEELGMPLVNGPVEFGYYFAKKAKWTTAPTKLSAVGDLIVCVRGSTTGRFVKSDDVYCLGRGVCSVRGIRSQCFVDQLFKISIEEMLGLTTGSTFPNWSRQTLSEFKALNPHELLIDQFDKLVSPKIMKLEAGVVESESLSKLRDTLLPKLLSGEIRIPEAEKMVRDLGRNGDGNGKS